MKGKYLSKSVIVIGLFVLTACSPGATADVPASPQQAVPNPELTQVATPAATPSVPDTAAPELVPVKTALEASDPSSVQLASGEPQLVEFFAFW